MKIAIANSLLEPAGIPWGDITPHTLAWSIKITRAVFRYTHAIDAHLQEGLPDITVQDIAIGINQVIRNHGIKEVYVGYKRLRWRDGSSNYQFHITYPIPGKKKLKKIYVNMANL